jgi:hypothetical protein
LIKGVEVVVDQERRGQRVELLRPRPEAFHAHIVAPGQPLQLGQGKARLPGRLENRHLAGRFVAAQRGQDDSQGTRATGTQVACVLLVDIDVAQPVLRPCAPPPVLVGLDDVL